MTNKRSRNAAFLSFDKSDKTNHVHPFQLTWKPTTGEGGGGGGGDGDGGCGTKFVKRHSTKPLFFISVEPEINMSEPGNFIEYCYRCCKNILPIEPVYMNGPECRTRQNLVETVRKIAIGMKEDQIVYGKLRNSPS
ncbi:hypothetical protein ACFE04_031951 [Oxalis oulophora]